MTSHRIGVNLRVSGNCDQGARKYMEDNHVIKFLKKDTDDYEFAYFGIFDGHGGPEASAFCRDRLLDEITKYDGFWTDDDDEVLSAIRKGFLDTHNAMWNVLDSWPKTVTGLPSTAGSTATIAIVKQGKLYTGHVGDSGLVLGENDEYSTGQFPVQAICVTKDHKPDDPDERLRIEDAGGEVINKSGVPRVVWSRPKTNHKGPVRRSTQIDQIPFLAVARSLGDLWSYDYYTETYVVSPDPDVAVLPLDASKHRCLILASDGLWNMLTPEESVHMVVDLESQFEQRIINDPNVAVSFWSNPAERLVARALNKWRSKGLKADNTSCVVVLVDPLGPSKLTLLKRKRQELLSAGEITSGTLGKMVASKMATDVDHRGKSRNQNANCSLSDSHIRVTDDSILRPSRESPLKPAVPPRRPVYAGHEGNEGELGFDERNNDSVNDSVQFLSAATMMGQRTEGDFDESVNSSAQENYTDHLRHGPKKPAPPLPPRQGQHAVGTHAHEHSLRRSAPVFTKLSELGNVHASSCADHSERKFGHTGVNASEKDQVNSSLVRLRHPEVVEGNMFAKPESMEGLDSSDSGQDSDIPQPPPCTPCSTPNNDNSDGENSLHSSADVTDIAFSLASDESLESPDHSFEDNRPPTPLSAPAKLLSSRVRRAGQMSKHSKKRLARSGRKVTNCSKPPAGRGSKVSTSVVKPASDLTKIAHKSSGTSSSQNKATKTSPERQNHKPSSPLTRIQLLKNSNSDTTQDVKTTTSSGLFSPPRRVLNTSRSMNDVHTPKDRNVISHSVSCTGLTPDMSMLLTEKKSVNGTGNVNISSQLFSSLMASNLHETRAVTALRSNVEASSMVEDDSFPQANSTVHHADPLKQLNKTGPLRKTGSRRFSNFLRASKLGLDQMFHLGSHQRKGGSSKLNSTSAGKLDLDSSKVEKVAGGTKNTSVSTSKLADYSLAHLPDITVSHFADITADSAYLPGDLTNLSALSEDDSMLNATGLERDAAHHSMLEEVLPGKVHKTRKGFLQKTRVTLKRAKKAAKKAFSTENHRLFSHKSSGNKRKSDEFLPTPEKRRRHMEAERTGH